MVTQEASPLTLHLPPRPSHSPLPRPPTPRRRQRRRQHRRRRWAHAPSGWWVHVWPALTHTRWPPWQPLRRWRTADARHARAVHRPPTSPHAWVVRDACSLVALRRHHPRSPRTDRHHRPLPSPLVVGRYHHPPSVTTGGFTTPAAHATAAAARASARPSVLYFAQAALPPQPPPSSR